MDVHPGKSAVPVSTSPAGERGALPFPRIVTAASVGACLALSVGGFGCAVLHTAGLRLQEAQTAQILLTQVERLQENLVSAARLETLSGDSRWFVRHEVSARQMNDALKAMQAHPLLQRRYTPLIVGLAAAGRGMITVERKAHTQTQAAHTDAARTTLAQPSYEAQRVGFLQNQKRLGEGIDGDLRSAGELQRIGFFSLAGAALLVCGSLGGVGVGLQRARKNLASENYQRQLSLKRSQEDLVRTQRQVQLLTAETRRLEEERNIQEKRLRRSGEMDRQLRMQEQAIDAANDVIIIAEASEGSLRVVRVNRAFYRMTGYTAEEILGKSPSMLQGVDTDRATVERIRMHIRLGKAVEAEILNYRKDGQAFWVQLNIQPVFEDGQLKYWMSIQRDVTERKRGEETLRWQATHDPLTRLPNRTHYEESLGKALVDCEEKGHPVGVLFIDLDNFKDVNDSLGHDAGDRLLQLVADRLRDRLPAGGMLARFGGDEFTVLLLQVESAARVSTIAQRLLDALDAAPFHLDGHELPVTASIGISIAPNDGRTISTLLKNADAAMYRAKDQGRDSFRLYNETMNSRVLDRLQIENQLRRALDRGEFHLLYQPQMDLATGRLSGVEALLRWENPVLGAVSPGLFIPIAEESDLIIEIGGWAMREACRQGALWHRQGRDIRVAVNISARQFSQKGLADSIRGALEDFHLPTHLLDLEITESTLFNEQQAGATLRRLKDLGIRLSVDDFGIGYSALSYISKLPLDILKIDKFFVSALDADRKNESMVRFLIELAHDLKLEVIAEGVETEGEKQALANLGCHVIQGYLFSRPTHAAEVEDLYDRSLLASLANIPPPQRTRLAKKVE